MLQYRGSEFLPASGWYFNLYLMDEVTKHDASSVVDMVAQTLEMIAKECEASQRPMPQTCLINTVREAKSQYLLAYLCNLCAAFKMRLCGLLCLRKSHTHDKLD